MLNQELVQYVEGEIIPRYASFDGAHREDHVRKVIEEAMNMSAHYDVDESVLLRRRRSTTPVWWTAGKCITFPPAGLSAKTRISKVVQSGADRDHRPGHGGSSCIRRQRSQESLRDDRCRG